MENISRNEVRAAIERGDASLVEALPDNFYAAGHLPGAVAIPFGFTKELAPVLIPDKQRLVVVYCSGIVCQNSALVADELKNLGYTNVRRYAEGKQDWKQAGLPLEEVAGAPPQTAKSPWVKMNPM